MKDLKNKNIVVRSGASPRATSSRPASDFRALRLRSSDRRSDTVPAQPTYAARKDGTRSPIINEKNDSRPYRENVVGFILNRRNEVLIMKRAGTARHWQLPQGGVEPNETKREAIMREMKEETGLKGLRIMGIVENFHAYDWPKAPLYAGDEFRGQRQTLFFLRYTAKGLGVSLDRDEATESRWVPMKDLLKWLAPIRHAMAKKALYSYQQLFSKKSYGGK